MANDFLFNQPLTLPPITRASLVAARDVIGSTKSCTLEIGFFGEAVQPPTPEPTEEVPEPEAPEPISFRLDNTIKLSIQDNACMRFRVNPMPRTVGDYWLVDQVEIPFAFDQVLGAWFMGGEDRDAAALAKLAELGLIPAGTAS